MADNDDLEMGYVAFVKDARSDQKDHKLIADNLINGHLLVVTEGVQVKDKPGKQGISKARERVKGHADKIVGNMKLQDEMAR